jgi:2-polyprenyl-3-methyl-5-hydroxy-6-metoxy-1,4-benzoquinol methylase
VDKPGKAAKAAKSTASETYDATKNVAAPAVNTGASQGFHLHRQAQAQRARVLSMVLIPFGADYSIPLRRAPDARLACAQAWGPAQLGAGDSGVPVASVASLRELLGLISAHEWRKKGVEIPALGDAPNNRIHPHYGVFSPVRGEYVALVAAAPWPNIAANPATLTAFDIGVGTGVLCAVLARRRVGRIIATDMDPRALACASENLNRFGITAVQLLQSNLFPPNSCGLADVIVCNPPWLPARPSSPLEHAVYDEGSAMLLGFLKGLAAHLAPGGQGWLILSDLAEHLGLRTRSELLAAIEQAGLQVVGRQDTKPVHAKAADATDPLHAARSVEVTSLWRLQAVGF